MKSTFSRREPFRASTTATVTAASAGTPPDAALLQYLLECERSPTGMSGLDTDEELNRLRALDGRARDEINELLARDKGERVADIRSKMQEVMMDKVSVVRNETGLREAEREIATLREAYRHVALQDKGKRYNTELTEAL